MKIRKMNKQKSTLEHFLFLTLFALFFNAIAYGQTGVIQGKVIGEDDGFPIPGVSIIIKGQTKGTATDFDGKFAIKANEGDVLIFTYIGMRTVNAKAINGMTVKMKSVAQDLSEVVVIGYGKVTKKELTGAVASVKAEDLSNQVTSDLGNALQGQISGVNVVSSGEPGSNSEILIRGVTSISGSNTPLYVVDGIPQLGDPGISPNEIETIDVLKDAASAAIYGTRGASGVIMITTKKGKTGALSVKVDASKGFETLGDGQKLLNAVGQTYVDMLLARNVAGTADNLTNLAPLSNAPDRFQYDNDISRMLFVDNAGTQNYSVNLSGGSNDLKYSFVGGFFDKKGIISRSSFQRFNTRSNVNYKKNKFSVNIGLGMIKEFTDRGAANTISQLLRYQPTQPILSIEADALDLFGGNDFNTNVSLLTSLNSLDEAKSTRAFTNIELGYEIIKGLNLSTRFGINDLNYGRMRFRPRQSTYDVQRLVDVVQPSSISEYIQRQSAITWDATLNYQTTIAENHKLTLTGALSSEKFINEEFIVTKTDISDNDITVLNSATGVASAFSGFDYTNRIAGMIGRLQYDYKGKYLISSSIRRDGSSRFAKQNRWGLFPSVSAAWNISDENFFKPLSGVVNNFKLRLSSGTVGNQNFQDYSYGTAIYRDLVYAFGDGNLASSAIQTTIGNPDVKWETSIQKNIGVDLAFFKNKLTVTAEYYQTDKEDMLFSLTMPPSVGLDDSSFGGGAPNSIRNLNNNNQVVLNIGNMTNSGFELAVGYRDKIGKLRYRMNGTFSTNQNRITKITDGFNGPILTSDTGIVPNGNASTSQITALAKGYEAGAYFVFATDGIANTPEKLAQANTYFSNHQFKMGDLIYKDVDGDGVFQSVGDRVYAGSGLPKYEIGYNLSLDYRNFDLYVNMYSALGHEIVNGARATAIGFGRSQEILNSYSDVNPNGTLPAYRGIFSAHPNYQPNTALFIEDGSYLRIRNITLGYNLPKKTTSALGIEKFRIFLTGQNLFTFTKYTGYNPEVGGNVNSKGLDKGNYPLTKMYLVGLNFNF
ncbi:TonB-dependent receptor [Flavobacterium sp. UMI-01]|uniref:SusC/RagA family TonB-linked outer membrane protein n=1 Tax=Flavobacterium sp. UMI-01 TaxID=1441053 RepID=UPI001C7CE748|nr:TonB-dependent receptor [Flavobacterium sp. UMI-01]GIZ08884.1 SusC/RagA family TonB-linked outer membrane protein [Flavobacterium sp. UMI-01]